MFADELGVGSRVVFADAEHLDVVILEVPPAVPEIARFFCAAWGVVFWVEIKNHPLSLERGQLDRFTVLVRQREIWS